MLLALKYRYLYVFAGLEFLFGQQKQSEDFQFAFSSTSPQATNKENSGDEFPFSFNFWEFRPS